MKAIKSIVLLLLIVCFLVALTGCRKPFGNDIDPSEQLPISSGSDAPIQPADGETDGEPEMEDSLDSSAEAGASVSEADDSDASRNDSAPAEDDESSFEIVVSDDMSFGEE